MQQRHNGLARVTPITTTLHTLPVLISMKILGNSSLVTTIHQHTQPTTDILWR